MTNDRKKAIYLARTRGFALHTERVHQFSCTMSFDRPVVSRKSFVIFLIELLVCEFDLNLRDFFCAETTGILVLPPQR